MEREFVFKKKKKREIDRKPKNKSDTCIPGEKKMDK